MVAEAEIVSADEEDNCLPRRRATLPVSGNGMLQDAQALAACKGYRVAHTHGTFVCRPAGSSPPILSSVIHQTSQTAALRTPYIERMRPSGWVLAGPSSQYWHAYRVATADAGSGRRRSRVQASCTCRSAPQTLYALLRGRSGAGRTTFLAPNVSAVHTTRSTRTRNIEQALIRALIATGTAENPGEAMPGVTLAFPPLALSLHTGLVLQLCLRNQDPGCARRCHCDQDSHLEAAPIDEFTEGAPNGLLRSRRRRGRLLMAPLDVTESVRVAAVDRKALSPLRQ
eukprot:scaffold1549_cov350-Prasinococcus_capsulatus_cf.AAC.8